MLTQEQEARAELTVADVRALYVQYKRLLTAVLRRLTWPGSDVEDLLQEVFVIALNRRDALGAAQEPRAWLYGAATRVAARARRRHKLRSFFGLDALVQTEATDPSPDARIHERETVMGVHRALEKLSSKKREVIVLFELEGLSGPEIAEALGCPLKTVWTRLHHARKDLEKLMVDHG